MLKFAVKGITLLRALTWLSVSQDGTSTGTQRTINLSCSHQRKLSLLPCLHYSADIPLYHVYIE